MLSLFGLRILKSERWLCQRKHFLSSSKHLLTELAYVVSLRSMRLSLTVMVDEASRMRMTTLSFWSTHSKTDQEGSAHRTLRPFLSS